MAQIQVNVSWREIPVFEEALLSDVADSVGFLKTKAPMPVGTMLIVSPTTKADVCVPARVMSVVEVIEAGSDMSQGMHVSFEAAFELLEPFLAEEPQPLVGLEPEPAFEPAAEPDIEEEDQPIQITAQPATAEGSDLPAAPTVPVDPNDIEQVKDSALTPSVSGEIDMPGMGEGGEDPDAPDKVIVMVDAALPPDGAVDGDGPGFDADDEQPEPEESPAEVKAEATESPKEPDRKKKKRRKGRRRKKK